VPPGPDEPPAGAAGPPPASALGDALADLAGGAVLADPGAAAWRDARFVDWLAAEARAADRAARRAGDAAFLARGDALLARAQARRLGVVRYAAAAAAAPRAGRVRERAAAPAAGRAVPVVDLGVAAGPGRELWDEPPARWVALPDGLPEARYVALRVVGTSMAPMLRSGDLVLVRADARGREARPGRVVVARHPDDGYVCKRVDEAGPHRLVLGSLEPGHGRVVLPGDPALVVGTVVAAWPGR
jgi:SOS-response transcriptional repressor LexA